jgi:hypothetical protein
MEPEAPAEKTRAGQEHQRRNAHTSPARHGCPARQSPPLPNQAGG